ncbi:hypothetical protein OEZ85_008981 [Tetradesmus obliquus]|uniref:SBP-type domain-containing protein n=1 Tax=Tetradesmus obliquus TaxID=3088 RepID=A0ABY8TL06_TETOB|nr:hypothetical protein OEZ85_008981 [Tetradesmus obliquus]
MQAAAPLLSLSRRPHAKISTSACKGFIYSYKLFCRPTMSSDSTICQQHQAPGKQQQWRPCRVEGCNADLSLEKVYCQKKAVCSEHLKADAVSLRGAGDALHRFCQQCGKMQPLAEFKGHKRSCRASLDKRKLQPEVLATTRETRRSRRQLEMLLLSEQQQQQQLAAVWGCAGCARAFA